MKQLTALEFAHSFEVKGVNLYLKLAAKNENPLVKRLFYSLANQEVDHAQQIDEIKAALEAGKAWKPSGIRSLPKVETALRNYFTAARRTELKKGAENLSGYELAMAMERKGYKAYEKFHRETTDPTEKEFLTHMMKEEAKHLEALMNVYHYLTQPGDYSQWEEGKVWGWMNT
jgi:rubrerythrin